MVNRIHCGNDVVEFLQQRLDTGESSEEIVRRLREHRQINASVRTVQRWIKRHGLIRCIAPTALQRSNEWLADVECMIRHGKTYEQVLHFLQNEYNENISLRTLEYIIQEKGISARKHLPQTLVESMVALESQGDGRLMGCRTMTLRLRQTYNTNVTRDAFNEAQRDLDPDANASRLQRRLNRRECEVAGPNALWHIDLNDKLRQFGFEIHGAIDGWSRKLMWLRMGSSNRLPEQILAYYLSAVESVGCMPARQRTDRGPENTMIAAVLCHFYGQSAHIFGRSVANQRIDCWWNQIYSMGIELWIEFFKNLERDGNYNVDDDYEYRCAIFVFGDLLEETLDKIFEEWNAHKMRKSSINPGGAPDILYAYPELYGAVQSGNVIPPSLVQYCQAAFPGSDADLADLFGVKMDRPVFMAALELQQLLPVTPNNMLTAYLYLREIREAIITLLP